MAYTTDKTFATRCCLVVKSEFTHHARLPDRRPPRAPISARQLNDLNVMLAAFIQVQLSFTKQARWHTCYLW